jgi:hypothetical protein
MVQPFASAAAFLLKTGLLSADVITEGEVAIEMTAEPAQPPGSYLIASNSIVGTGGIKLVIATGTGESRVEHLVCYSPMAV